MKNIVDYVKSKIKPYTFVIIKETNTKYRCDFCENNNVVYTGEIPKNFAYGGEDGIVKLILSNIENSKKINNFLQSSKEHTIEGENEDNEYKNGFTNV